MRRKTPFTPNRGGHHHPLLAHALACAAALALPFTTSAVTMSVPAEESIWSDPAGLVRTADDGTVTVITSNRSAFQDVPQAMELMGIRTTMANDLRYADRSYADFGSEYVPPAGANLFTDPNAGSAGGNSGATIPPADLTDLSGKTTPAAGGTTPSGNTTPDAGTGADGGKPNGADSSASGSGSTGSSDAGTSDAGTTGPSTGTGANNGPSTSGKDGVDIVVPDAKTLADTSLTDTSIPEPIPMLLTGLGLVGVAFLKRAK